MKLYIKRSSGVSSVFRSNQYAPGHQVVLITEDNTEVEITQFVHLHTTNGILLPVDCVVDLIRETAREFVCAIRDYDERCYGGLELDDYLALCEYAGKLLPSTWFDDHNVWVVNSVADWCEELCADCGYLRSVPDFMKCHINFSAIADDLFLDGGYSCVELEDNYFIIYSE